MHSGTASAVAKAKGEAVTAWAALTATGDEPARTVDPAQAVMGMLHMSWLRAHHYASLLKEQVDREGGIITPETGAKGLIGWRLGSAGTAGELYEQSEEIRAIVQLEASERDRCVRYAKTAHDMGIADREIELAERQARAVAVALGTVLDMLSLDAARRDEVQEAFMKRLREQVTS
ncbi:MAG: hypothetical protein GEV10_31475 [Streptosporangiales bacterium]|nr:hypothetical protein [Streptosporangiales bacterium]